MSCYYHGAFPSTQAGMDLLTAGIMLACPTTKPRDGTSTHGSPVHHQEFESVSEEHFITPPT